MASFGPRKRTRGDDMDGDDIISRLPEDIKDKILTKLPIKDSVRTSILSTNWRYTWASSIPEIVVRDDLVPAVDGDTPLPCFLFVKNVDLLLLNHRGPILKFDLSTKYYCPEAFDRWFLNLSRNGITDLTFLLNSASLSKYQIPSNFFCCDALQHVDLSSYLIELPRGFEGFKLLSTLKLRKCTISAAHLEWLVSGSSRLVKLILEFSEIKGDFKIVSNGLKVLTAVGDFSDLQIEAPNLISLHIEHYNNNSPSRARCINKFCKSLSALLNIRDVRLGGSTLQYLVGRSLVEILNSCLKKLSNVSMVMDLADQEESSFAYSLFQNATNLQDLHLIVKMPGNTTSLSIWEKNIVFKSMQVVHIHNFIASESVVVFVKFILSSAPNLRKLILKEDPKELEGGNIEMLKRLLKFPRASTRVEVIFE